MSEHKKNRIMESVFDQTAVGICITDEKRQFVEVNDAYCQIYGYSRDELIGQPFTIVVPDNFKKQAEHLHDVFLEGVPELPVEWVVQRKDGTLITIVVTAALMVETDGSKYKITTVTDVTEQRRAERLVNRLGRIISKSYDEIYILEGDTLNIVQANDTALKNLGYTFDEINRKSFLDIIQGVSITQLKEMTQTIVSGEDELRIFEAVKKRKDLSSYPVEVKLQFMAEEEPPVFVAIVQEITERKKLTQIQRELDTARQIQNRLMPDRMPEIKGYSIFGISRPSKEVGGDYFDFQLTEDNKMAFCLGDVSGKGMPAALLMSNLQAIVRVQTMSNASPSDCLEICNRMIRYNAPSNRFVSFFYGKLDTETHRIVYSNAGHNPPVLVTASKEHCYLPKGNMALGLHKKVTYGENHLLVETGDVFAVFSDGVIEAMNQDGEIYGEDRLVALLKSHIDMDVQSLAGLVVEDVFEFMNGMSQHDDLTILLLKRN